MASFPMSFHLPAGLGGAEAVSTIWERMEVRRGGAAAGKWWDHPPLVVGDGTRRNSQSPIPNKAINERIAKR